LCKGKGKYTDVIIVLAAFLCTCKINYKIWSKCLRIIQLFHSFTVNNIQFSNIIITIFVGAWGKIFLS
jgi:hypothetical protein